MKQASNLSGELLRKQDVYNKLHALGGCDADEEWSKGWDAAVSAMVSNLDDLPVVERGYKLKVCPFCGGNAVFKTVGYSSSHNDCGVEVKIVCSRCGAEAQPGKVHSVKFRFYSNGTVEALTKDLSEAVDKWNRRSYEGLYDGKFSDDEEDDEA